jgi:chemotaxis protein CheD
MFPGQKAAGVPVGRRNGEAARQLLLAHGIELVSESLFGDGHRQIVFDVATGDVWARQLAPADAAAGLEP